MARSERELARAKAVLQRRTQTSGLLESTGDVRVEIARIARAILQGRVEVFEEFGGLQAATRRSVALEKQLLRQPAPGLIRRASMWRTMRLAGVRFR